MPVHSLGGPAAAAAARSHSFETSSRPYSPSSSSSSYYAAAPGGTITARLERPAESTGLMYVPNEGRAAVGSRYLVRQKIVDGPRLDETDTQSLSAKQVLFYFGVLNLKEPCLQQQQSVEYAQDRSGMWSAKLVLGRESISIPQMKTRMAAKVEICRMALSLLKPRFPSWRVPDEPSLDLSAPEWHWGSLLEGKASLFFRGKGSKKKGGCIVLSC